MCQMFDNVYLKCAIQGFLLTNFLTVDKSPNHKSKPYGKQHNEIRWWNLSVGSLFA